MYSLSKFGTDVSNEKLLNAAKCQGYSCYCLLQLFFPWGKNKDVEGLTRVKKDGHD